jgi:hypothetical protein
MLMGRGLIIRNPTLSFKSEEFCALCGERANANNSNMGIVRRAERMVGIAGPGAGNCRNRHHLLVPYGARPSKFNGCDDWCLGGGVASDEGCFKDNERKEFRDVENPEADGPKKIGPFGAGDHNLGDKDSVGSESH